MHSTAGMFEPSGCFIVMALHVSASLQCLAQAASVDSTAAPASPPLFGGRSGIVAVIGGGHEPQANPRAPSADVATIIPSNWWSREIFIGHLSALV
jgi:hypothetical protein